jgi:RNA-binding protein
MPLSEKQKRHLRSLAHNLKPIVTVGQAGLSAAVLDELEGAISHHELVKVKVNAGDRGMRDDMIRAMLNRCAAQLVQRVGHIAVLYRHNPEKRSPLTLPE